MTTMMPSILTFQKEEAAPTSSRTCPLGRGAALHKAGFPSVRERTRYYGCFFVKNVLKMCLGAQNDIKPPIRDIFKEMNV